MRGGVLPCAGQAAGVVVSGAGPTGQFTSVGCTRNASTASHSMPRPGRVRLHHRAILVLIDWLPAARGLSSALNHTPHAASHRFTSPPPCLPARLPRRVPLCLCELCAPLSLSLIAPATAVPPVCRPAILSSPSVCCQPALHSLPIHAHTTLGCHTVRILAASLARRP